MTAEQPLKGITSLLLGLAINCIGIDPTAGFPRFTFGSVELLQGISFIPAMIGMFALSELMRGVVAVDQQGAVLAQKIGNIFVGVKDVMKKYWFNFLRGSAIGVLIGALPGAGADIAAWISYAVSKRFSKEADKFGTGHIEGIVDATSANNSALGGAWIPALVFGIPGDSITAIVIGVLYMKGMNPGPTVFLQNPQFIYAVFIIFILANLLMLPFGWLAIKSGKQILRVPRRVLLPVILIFCVVGSYAMTNSVYGIWVMLVLGILGWLMEEHGFPIAPAILGLVLGELLEQSFMTSMIKADGNPLMFFERPIAAILGILTLLIWATMIWRGIKGQKATMAPSEA
jgi:TctA family transporter